MSPNSRSSQAYATELGNRQLSYKTKYSETNRKCKECSKEEGVSNRLDWEQEIWRGFMGEGAFEVASEDDGAEPTAEKHTRQGQHKQRHRGLCPEGGNRSVWPEWKVK